MRKATVLLLALGCCLIAAQALATERIVVAENMTNWG
jgi:hypothetical protein